MRPTSDTPPKDSTTALLDEFFAGSGEDVLQEDAPPEGFRSGYVAFVGRPNVGKSTLMNCFLEQRIAIVTPKPQTTRRKTLGILNTDAYQVVMLDTPGIMEPKYALHEAMIDEAMSAFEDADVIVYLAEATRAPEILPALEKTQKPRLLALNKVDRVPQKNELLPVLEGYSETGLFDEILPICALSGDGVADLLQAILSRLPEAPPLYPREQVSEQPERFFVAEIVRERIFRRYEQEVPYSTEVLVTRFDERGTHKDFIEATIFVEADSQKAIVIGKRGLAIKELGEDARDAIEAFLGREVFLSLRVKTMPKWRKKAAALRKLGYKR
ncbi:MAG: GTPase Era [Candidatus Eisenbacteria bacterium]